MVLLIERNTNIATTLDTMNRFAADNMCGCGSSLVGTDGATYQRAISPYRGADSAATVALNHQKHDLYLMQEELSGLERYNRDLGIAIAIPLCLFVAGCLYNYMSPLLTRRSTVAPPSLGQDSHLGSDSPSPDAPSLNSVLVHSTSDEVRQRSLTVALPE